MKTLTKESIKDFFKKTWYYIVILVLLGSNINILTRYINFKYNYMQECDMTDMALEIQNERLVKLTKENTELKESVDELNTLVITSYEVYSSQVIKITDELEDTQEELKDTTEQLQRMKDIINNSIIVDKFQFPVDMKYVTAISCGQGLRDVIALDDGTVVGGNWHDAIDIACPDKTPVYATKDGVVIENWLGYLNGRWCQGHKQYGGCIVIAHTDGTYSLYAHLSRTDIHEGDKVTKGQQIGLSGGVKGRRASGSSTGPHLHYSHTFDIMESFMR